MQLSRSLDTSLTQVHDANNLQYGVHNWLAVCGSRCIVNVPNEKRSKWSEGVFVIEDSIAGPNVKKTEHGSISSVKYKPRSTTNRRLTQLNGQLCVLGDLQEYIGLTKDIHEKRVKFFLYVNYFWERSQRGYLKGRPIFLKFKSWNGKTPQVC